MDYPDRPTNRPDPIIENGHKAPDQRKAPRSKMPVVLVVAGILVIAVAAVATTYESDEQAANPQPLAQGDRRD